MILAAIPFPQIDPVALAIGPILGITLAIRWYALAYIGGIIGGWWLGKRLMTAAPACATPRQVDDFVTWITLGIIIGGRLGYVLFYKPGYYLAHPLEALMVWQGGMSFHGGMLGVVVAVVAFCRMENIDLLSFGDRVAAVVPIGLGLGRLANFINGELFGRVAPDVPWAMVFPGGGPLPRHPSQLYQAGLEGLLLFAVLMFFARQEVFRARRGFVAGLFLCGYALARIVGEVFREPDAHLGFLFAGATMGQLLSLPMFLAGSWLILRSRRG
jgi:phosphatidylglycerol---prolipoprotein diacylglyceryl transferase